MSVGTLLNFVWALVWKILPISKRNFSCSFLVVLKLRSDYILVEIELKIKGGGGFLKNQNYQIFQLETKKNEFSIKGSFL